MKKRILIISQHFWPENFRISDIAVGFRENDIEVDVICGIPNYPNGVIPKGYGFFKNLRQDYNGVKVFRTWEVTRTTSNLRIFLNYISFPFFASFKVLSFLNKNYDAVFCYETSPVYMILPAIIYSKIKKIPLTTYVLDLWPENLYSVLDIKNPLLRKFLEVSSHWHYKKSDKLIAMSPSLSKVLQNITKKDAKQIATIPQYCEELYEEKLIDEELNNKYKDYFKIIYTGNISPAQNLKVLILAMKKVKEKGIKDIKCIIVGDGMSKSDIENLVIKENLQEYFDFLGSKAVSDMPYYYSLADCLFASLAKSDDIGLTIPAKITSYLAGEKPILASLDGEGANIIQKANCGLASAADDEITLSDNIINLYNMSKNDRAVLSKNALAYHLEFHQRKKVLQKLIDFIFYDKKEE